MPFSMADHWQGVYRTKGEAEVSWFQDDPAPSLDLIAAAGCGPHTALVDVGGGASRLVDALLRRGFRDLTVLDLSAAALDTARSRIGETGASVDWIVADVTTWQPSRPYGLWHDRAAFHFLTEPPQRQAYVKALRQALPEGTHAVIATFAPDGPQTCSGLPVMRYGGKELADELGPGFARLDTRAHAHATPWGGVQSFLFSLFRRL